MTDLLLPDAPTTPSTSTPGPAPAAARDAVVVPAHLLQQIADGRCLAFVGAGFAAPAVPAWTELLRGLAAAAELDDAGARWVADLIDGGSARDLEAAAQVLQGALGSRFDGAVADLLASSGRVDRIAERRRLLAGIPFDAILTTNFDPFLVGDVPGPAAYRRVLRDPPHRWWEPRYWHGGPDGLAGAPVVKLHGQAGPVGDDVVFTQRDYRERLYSSPAYMTFLRSLFATSTVLFIGVSFTDAYLNELRSEVLAMLDHGPADDPVAYAVLPDVSPHQARYLREHEGLGVLPFDTRGGTDWSGFEAVLGAIHDATNPRALLGRAVAGRRVLWVDADPDDTAEGARLLHAAADGGAGVAVRVVRSAAEALEVLAAEPVDVVITDWADGGRPGDAGEGGTGLPVLAGIRAADHRVPVVVFTGAHGRPADRRAAMGLGAAAIADGWGELFAELARVLDV